MAQVQKHKPDLPRDKLVHTHLFDGHECSGADVLGLVAGGERAQADLLALQPLGTLLVGLFRFGITRQRLWCLSTDRKGYSMVNVGFLKHLNTSYPHKKQTVYQC